MAPSSRALRAVNSVVHTSETGQPGNLQPASWWQGNQSITTLESKPSDPNFDLRFPYSTVIFDQMVRTDAQVGGLFRGITLSIRRARWNLDTSGCRAEVAKFVRTEIGLPEHGKTLPARPFSTLVFDQHLRQALSSLQYGHSVYERIYAVDPATGVVHLNRLADRPQRTLKHFLIDDNGDLLFAVQAARPTQSGFSAHWAGIPIPADVLVVYSHEREGADWSGVSILRSAYKHWLVKDVLLRLSGQIVERNGMGVPTFAYDGNTVTKEDALELVQAYRAGAEAGMVYPAGNGNQFTLQAVSGQLVDPLPLMKYQDEQIAQSALAMFLTLGHDAGARSLGDTFLDVFTNSLQAVADFISHEFTTQVITPLVRANYGPDEVYPQLSPGDMSSDGIVNPKDLNLLSIAGLIRPDRILEDFLRNSIGLPHSDPANQAPYELPGMLHPPDPTAMPGQAPAGPPGPHYDGVNPAAPIGQRVNQPITGPAPKVTNLPIAAVAYAQNLMHRIETLAANHRPEE